MNWKVRFIDYPAQFRKQEPEIMACLRDVLSAGDLMMRQQLRDFESNLAAFVGTKYAVGMSNCTDALHLSLRASGIGAGDEVISVSHTFVATIAAIHHTGATPVLVDIGEDHNIDVDLIERAVTPRTRAIIPVHLNGRVSRMDVVLDVARRHELVVIEDSAQALGASFEGTRGGAFGLAGCFSFYPAKLLGAFGDAGAVTTNSEELATKLRQLRDHGRTPDGDLSGWSFNCRLDNIHAAILDLRLRRLPRNIERRRAIAATYDDHLAHITHLKLPPRPQEVGPFFDVFQNYEIEARERDGLVAHLRRQGVEILIPWGGRAVHQFSRLGLSHTQVPRTEQLFRNVLMLPMHAELSDEDVMYVCRTVQEFYGD
jgi:dTDP-4-amino-4,6-dideoxygalactose transaminase